MSKSRLPLRRYLFLLVIAGILPLAVLSGVGLVTLFEEQRRETLQRAQEITRALDIAVEAELQRSLSSLKVLATSEALHSRDLRAFHELARRATAAQPEWLSINLTTTSGERVVDTNIEFGQPLPAIVEMASHREAVRTGEAQIGVLVKGSRGRHAFALRVPVSIGGKIGYVLSAPVDPRAIVALVQRQKVPQDWVISVFDSAGSRVARSRAHEQYLGQPAAVTLRKLMASGASEGSGLTHVLEGTPVFTAFTRGPTGWSVAIGIPEAEVNRTAVRATRIYAFAVAASILAGLLAAFWLARRANRSIDQLRDAALALGRGEEPAQPESGIAEVHEVGAAVVASARQRRAIEREREELLHREQAARGDAETANRQKDQFLAMLAHELRNPLAAISNASALLDDSRAAPETQARARGVIRRQTTHLARLTDDLLDAARALLGKIQLDVRPVDLAALVAQLLRTLATTGRTGNHKIVEKLEEAWVSGDPVRLDQIASNMLENAVKYTPAGGLITVKTGRKDGDAFLSVADTGVGIAPELAGRVFDLFVQGSRDIDRRQGGLGIGLTLVKRLAELHGGDVQVRSGGEEQGSKFTLHLPAMEKPVPAASPAKAAPPSARSILLVEDNDDARETLHTLLEMSGHVVQSAPDGIAGLEKALDMDPDVALVDIGLPGIDGFELARRIRAASGARMLLIALTGYGAEEDRVRVMEAGFDAHVTKPADLSELEALIARSRPRREGNNLNQKHERHESGE